MIWVSLNGFMCRERRILVFKSIFRWFSRFYIFCALEAVLDEFMHYRHKSRPPRLIVLIFLFIIANLLQPTP